MCSFGFNLYIDSKNKSNEQTTTSQQVEKSNSFKGKFRNENLKLNLVLNLYEANIPVPGLEMDSCYGYINGNINGSWAILKVKSIDQNKALVRMVNDRGSDGQNVEITLTDSGVALRQIDDVNIKGVVNSKYVKLPKIIDMIRN